MELTKIENYILKQIIEDGKIPLGTYPVEKIVKTTFDLVKKNLIESGYYDHTFTISFIKIWEYKRK